MTIFLQPSDPRLFIPSIEELENMNSKVKYGNCKKLEKYLNAIVTSSLSNPSHDIIERCKKLISLCYQGIAQEQIPSQLVLKACAKFEKWGVLNKDSFPDEVTFVDANQNKIGINKHLLMVHSPEFAKRFLADLDIEALNLSSMALLAFKDYILQKNIQQNLSVEDFAALYQTARANKINDLCVLCFHSLGTLILSDHALVRHGEIVWTLHSQIDNLVSEAQKAWLALDFINNVTKQNQIEGIFLHPPTLSLSLTSLYLLRKPRANGITDPSLIGQAKAIRSILKKYVNCLRLTNRAELKLIGQLELLSEKIKSAFKVLKIESAISLEVFNSIVKHFPNIEALAITFDSTNHVELIPAIMKMQKIHTLRLLIPKPTQESEEKQQNLLINGPTTESINTSVDLFQTLRSTLSFNKANEISAPPKTNYATFTFSLAFCRFIEGKVFEVSEKCMVVTPGMSRENSCVWFEKKCNTINAYTTRVKNTILLEPRG